MCISFAVGQNCPNSTNDVRTIQIALNLAKSKTHENTMKGFNLGNGGTVAEQVLHSMSPDLVTDGKYGNKTLKAIQNFQKNIVGMKQPDGKIEPGKGTIKALQACMSTTLNAEKLQAIYIHAPRSRIDKFFPHLTPMMTASKINTSSNCPFSCPDRT